MRDDVGGEKGDWREGGGRREEGGGRREGLRR